MLPAYVLLAHVLSAHVLFAVVLPAVILVGAGGVAAQASPSFAAVASGPPPPATSSPSEVFNYGKFGAVSIYRARARQHDVVLLMSDDSGWSPRVAALAQRLAADGAVVIGVDWPHYRAALESSAPECISMASDLENLSHYAQAKLGLKRYWPPVLVGYSAGAAAAYATLAQAPQGLFSGLLTIDFCPRLELKKSVCENLDAKPVPVRNAQGAIVASQLSPTADLPGRWIDLQEAGGAVGARAAGGAGAAIGARAAGGAVGASRAPACTVPAVQTFAAGVRGSSVVQVPSAVAQPVDVAFAKLAGGAAEAKSAALPAAVADLPLTVVPASGGGHADWFGILLSGDGGWVQIDKSLSSLFAAKGIPIVGWDSLKYFWSRRTPEGTSHDLERVMTYYSRAWRRSRVLLIGYSQGADTLPFMINRLPPAIHQMVGYTALLGISDNALFEFHVANWLGQPPKGIPTAPELARWSGAPYLCLYGASDEDAACAQITAHDGIVVKLPGGHHFAGSYPTITNEILSRLPTRVASRRASPQSP